MMREPRGSILNNPYATWEHRIMRRLRNHHETTDVVTTARDIIMRRLQNIMRLASGGQATEPQGCIFNNPYAAWEPRIMRRLRNHHETDGMAMFFIKQL